MVVKWQAIRLCHRRFMADRLIPLPYVADTRAAASADRNIPIVNHNVTVEGHVT